MSEQLVVKAFENALGHGSTGSEHVIAKLIDSRDRLAAITSYQVAVRMRSAAMINRDNATVIRGELIGADAEDSSERPIQPNHESAGNAARRRRARER